MWITHSYLGTARGNMRCLFFLLLEDYIDEQGQFAKELSTELERFGRNLGSDGAVVKAFSADIESARKGVLDKNWGESELEEIQKTPSLLMIDTDFDAFDPQTHRWVIFNLGARVYEGVPGAHHYREALSAIANAVAEGGVDPFEVARQVQYEVKPSDALKVFEAKPGAFGFSIDLVNLGKVVSRLFKRYAD